MSQFKMQVDAFQLQQLLPLTQHREHLLSPDFSDVGFGVAFGRDSTGYIILWVQDFARPRVKR